MLCTYIVHLQLTSHCIFAEILGTLSSSSPVADMTVFTTAQTNVGVHDGVGQHFTGSHDTTIVHHSSSVSSVKSTTTNVNSTIHLPQGLVI